MCSTSMSAACRGQKKIFQALTEMCLSGYLDDNAGKLYFQVVLWIWFGTDLLGHSANTLSLDVTVYTAI